MLALLLILLSLDFFVYHHLMILVDHHAMLSEYRVLFQGVYFAVIVATIGYFIFYRFRLASPLVSWPHRLMLALGIGVYISKFVGSLFLLLDDVRLGFGWLVNVVASTQFSTSASWTWNLIGISGMIFLYGLLVYGIFRNRHRYKVHKVKVPIKNLASSLQGLRIVQISDVHAGSFRRAEDIADGIKKINELNADLFFFTGDLVNNMADEINPYIEFFQKINARYGKYAILGNHDYGDYIRWTNLNAKRENLSKLYKAHRQLGWDLLINEHRTITFDAAQLNIIGVENISAKGRFSKYGDLEQAMKNRPKANVNILLSHDPSHWDAEVTADFKEIDLTLSGHTHGMQFGIELKNGFKWSPIQYVYKQWAGLYQSGKQYLYVNRGFGYLGYPGRVGILPEITLIELVKE